MENVTLDKAFDFALRIVKLGKYLRKEHKEFILSRQVLRSGTSIGANIAEANGGISKQDFSAKISIAYKEALETKYWLKLLHKSDYIDFDSYVSINRDCEDICRILFSILKSTRIKPKN